MQTCLHADALSCIDRLAFRELGTVMGVACNSAAPHQWATRASSLLSFWRDKLFVRDRDIAPVMFCAGLMPGVWRRKE